MKILLIRPQDGLLSGAWVGRKWDRIVDLGYGGIRSYETAASELGAAVTPLSRLSDSFQEARRTRDLLTLGRNRLQDRLGLDWWALNSILVHQRLEATILLQELAATIAPHDEVWVSGDGFHAQALRSILRRRVESFDTRSESKTPGHYFRTFRKFPLWQLLEIFWDKTDASYQFRSHFSRRPKPHKKELVLLPSAYGNVSRTGTEYAASVPDLNFLLVSTRRSGMSPDLPENVSGAWLSSYASPGTAQRKAEFLDLTDRWNALRRELEDVPEFKTISECNSFEIFTYYFWHGLGVRDAWNNVLGSEPVKAILCADDSNPFTHVPLLLGKQRGLRTISCHHGALDGRSMVKECHADVVLAKNKMEQDYLTRLCGISGNKVLIGAPPWRGTQHTSAHDRNATLPVFFSEPYEATGGRAADAYGDVLPLLSDLALKRQRQLIVKLHPAESATERRQILERTLTREQLGNTRVISGPLTPELLERTWFGVTVLSTVVLECALSQVPCFLCRWLESSPYGYVDQFVRFRLGIPLDHPNEIAEIPDRILALQDSPPVKEFWEEASGTFLRQLLSRATEGQTHGASRGIAPTSM